MNQWATLGLLIANREMGIPIPEFVKTELAAGLPGWYNSTVGAFGYESSNSWLNSAKTGGNLSTLLLLGDDANSPRVTLARKFVGDQWARTDNPYGNIGDFYTMFSVMKGARSFTPALTTFTGSNNVAHDWYAEYRTWLVNNWRSNGSVVGNQWPMSGESTVRLTTAMGVEILQQVFLSAPPVAKAIAITPIAPTNGIAQVRHNGSYHNDASLTIVQYAWDINNDGNYDVVTANANQIVNIATGAAGTITAVLRVTD